MTFIAVGISAGTTLLATFGGAAAKGSQNKKAIAAAKKQALTDKTIEARIRLEEIKAKAKRQQNNIIVIGSLASLGIGVIVYMTVHKTQNLKT